MKRILKRTAMLFSALLIGVLSFFESLAFSSVSAETSDIQAVTVYAATSSNIVYTNVLDDLKKDNSFSTSNYPEKANDYSLQVIQIAESTDKELFVYVYQPSGQKKKLSACSINISTTINDEISYFNYKLQLLNSNGVFFKYKVQDFTVKDEPTCYYAISSIYRPFDETIDKQAEYDNKITEVNYAVSKQYCFSMINGKPYVNVVEIETITITDKFVGFVRYDDGFKLFQGVGACDSHFVAFNTDKPIDKLLEADVYYTTQKVSLSYVMEGKNFRTDYGEKELNNYAYLKYTDKVEHNGGGLFAGTYTWDRIETVEQFITENDLTQSVYSGAILDVNVANRITDEGKAALQGKKWVLRFVETQYTKLAQDGMGAAATYYDTDQTLVGDVTILRLKFEYDGVTYNLGTIDNKQTSSDNPINVQESEGEDKNWLKIFFALLALIVLLVIFMPILPTLVSGIVQVLCLPFKLLSALFKGISKAFHKRE